MMANRYKDNPRVVGADLYNEVRRDVLVDPNWGWGNDVDWYAAAQYAADKIHLEANPNLLIIIEGINWVGLPIDGFPHGRPTLSGAEFLSHTLMGSDKLVYSAHFYSYTGPNHSGANGIGETHDPRYRDLSATDLAKVIEQSATFVALRNDFHYTRPIWISEFGIPGRGIIGATDISWFDNFLGYLKTNDLDFAYWPLVGFLENGYGNGWALLNWDRQRNVSDGLYDGNDWRRDRWLELVNATSASGPIGNSTKWSMLNVDYSDYAKSHFLSKSDWDVGARKAACNDDMRLIGISRKMHRGLCTDAMYGGQLLDSSAPSVTVTNERFVSTDWAATFSKLECPANHYVIGYAIRGARMSSVSCAKTKREGGLGGNGRTIWFDKGDNRADGNLGGEFALSDYKGQCRTNEYVAGIAYTLRGLNSGWPAAIYCKSVFEAASAAVRQSHSPAPVIVLHMVLGALFLVGAHWV
ncbi:hypothetical protein FRB91_004636 [Serendipita sp. 411]|nr:hypothetical protein FRB91_004636 [Serendipita sp. 411]